MKNETETTESEPGIIMLATSLPQAETAAAPGAPKTSAGLIDYEEIEEGLGRKSYNIGDMTRSLLEKFLGARKKDWAELQAEERESQEVAARHEFFVTAIQQSRERLQTLRAEIENFYTVNLALTIYKNRLNSGIPIGNLLMSQSGAAILASALMIEQGPKVMALAEAEHGSIEESFRAFKHQKQGILRKLKLA